MTATTAAIATADITTATTATATRSTSTASTGGTKSVNGANTNGASTSGANTRGANIGIVIAAATTISSDIGARTVTRLILHAVPQQDRCAPPATLGRYPQAGRSPAWRRRHPKAPADGRDP